MNSGKITSKKKKKIPAGKIATEHTNDVSKRSFSSSKEILYDRSYISNATYDLNIYCSSQFKSTRKCRITT